MYYFKEQNGISLYNGNKAVLTKIAPWVNVPIYPSSGKELRLPLVPKTVSDTAVDFESENGAAKLTLSVKEENGCFAVFATGQYDATGAPEYGTHLCEYNGLGFDFDIPHTGNFVDAYMRCLFWQAAFIGKKTGELKPRTQALFVQQGKTDKAYLMTVCHKDYKGEIFPNGKIASLKVRSNIVKDDIDECVLIGACGKDEYALPEQTVEFGLRIMNKTGKLRKEKKYPEMFEYLGWCSWDAFHMDVTAQNLLDKAKEFKDKEIPVKWIIIDDMWGDVTAIDRKTMHARSLNDWEADPVRFPNGLKGAIGDIKAQYGLKVGMWHPTTGYWFGINPLGKLAREHGDLLEYTMPGNPASGSFPMSTHSFLMHSFERKKVEKYYDLQHAFYKDCGADFTKVDNQGHTERYSHNKGSIGECTTNLHNAIEKAAKKYYGGALINCMGMPNENFWNRGYSNVNRFSGDFQPENRKWFIQHLLQCSYNSLTQGTVFTGDWDMWWSDDDQAKKNAVLRSMSGGPIYMSDELNRSIKSVIMPTVFSDGRIIRLADPALPTRDCMFESAEHNGKIYKVFNKIGNCGVIAAFNMDENEAAVNGTVSPSDVNGLKAGKYCVYDWFKKEAFVMAFDEQAPLTLENYDDFRLLLFVPIQKGKAVIGLNEKYMAPATVKRVKGGVQALDDGTLTVYADEAPNGFDALAENLYTKQVKKGEVVVL